MKKIFLIIALFTLSAPSYSQDDLDKMVERVYRLVEQKNHEQLTNMFNNPIHLKILSTENIYSINQAEKTLKHFLDENISLTFIENQRGRIEDGAFSVGTYHCPHNEFFRIYFLIKYTKQGTKKIFQFFIENDKFQKSIK